MKRSLCIFLKKPLPGRVGSALAGQLGEKAAAELHGGLVCEVFRQVKKADPDEIAVFFAPADEEAAIRSWLDPWLRDFPGEVTFSPQSEGDLGRRLAAAGDVLFAREKDTGLLTIGTDCIDLDRDLLGEAWDHLENDGSGVVVGPSANGGCYLIGSRQPIPEIVGDLPSNGEGTCAETLRRAEQFRKNCFLLPEKIAIDTIDEYRRVEDRLNLRPCVFFDRDGVVNKSPGSGYVLKKEEFHINDGLSDCLRAARDAGCYTIIVTSQKGVGKKLMTEADLREIHRELQRNLSTQGLAFDGIFYHTGLPGDQHSPKPDPGMILAASREFPIDLSRSWMIGDADRDIEMGRKAKLLGTIRVKGDKPISVASDHTVGNLMELAKLLKNLL